MIRPFHMALPTKNIKETEAFYVDVLDAVFLTAVFCRPAGFPTRQQGSRNGSRNGARCL